MATPDITLYSCSTPNGWKISALLEELGLPYKLRPVDLSKKEQKEEWFLQFNPNGRLPAITDGQTRVFESGAILLYLADKYDTERRISYSPGDLPGYTEQLSWLFWQVGGLGPMQGQAVQFGLSAPVRSDFGIQRYNDETRRLYTVLNTRLETSPYLAGDKFSIADIACIFWVRAGPKLLGLDISEWPAVQKWHDNILEREAAQKALKAPASKTTDEDFIKHGAEKRRLMLARTNSDI